MRGDVVGELDAATEGAVLDRSAPAFDRRRRVWNARIDTEPLTIVVPTGVEDVASAVGVAAAHDLTVAAKGGGHHVGGSAVVPDGITVDLSELNGVDVDPDAHTVTVGGGATWGEVDAATAEYGFAAVGGQDPNIGVAGLTLGGGVGWLSRAFGLAADNLLEAEVVTAEGSVLQASAADHPDLFWGLRGAGGCLGIVTSFTFRLHPVERVLAGSLLYPLEHARTALAGYRELVADSPDTLRPLFGLFDLPPSSPLADRMDEDRVAIIIVCAIEPFEAATAALDPIRARTDPAADTVKPRPYAAFQRAGESDTHARTALRSQYVDALTDDVIDAVVSCGTDAPSAGATVFVSPRAGAEVEPAVDATAYPHRHPCHHVLVEARWQHPSDDERHDRWVREGAADLAPHAANRASINFIDADEPSARAAMAFVSNLERVRSVKARWDPDDRFGGHARQRSD